MGDLELGMGRALWWPLRNLKLKDCDVALRWQRDRAREMWTQSEMETESFHGPHLGERERERDSLEPF